MDSDDFKRIAIKILLLTTIMAAATISSYSTYLGFAAILPHEYSLGLAIVSGLILVSLSYFFSYIIHKNRYFIPRLSITIGIMVLIFTFSTLWSIVGIAKDQLFQELVSETSNDFYNQYASIDTGNYLESLRYQLRSLEGSLAVSYDNSLEGLYTGSKRKGGLARNFELLQNKSAAAAEQTERQIALYEEKIREINTLANSMQTLKRHDDKAQYAELSRTINMKLNTFRAMEVKTTLDPVIAGLQDTVNNLLQIRDNTLNSDTSKGMVTSEINSLKAFESNLKSFQEKGVPTLPEINLESLDRSIVSLSFDYMARIFNWWALSLAIDFCPLIFMYFFAGEQNSVQYYIKQQRQTKSL